MIKYSSEDIIKRAEQLADLENSDFISDYEKLTLLNENWTMLYQKIINAGDKTFIKKLSVCNGTKLPPDFYQLSDIYTKKGHMPVTRCNSLQIDGYDIVDGRIVLSKNYNGVDVVAEYYPAPKTLYLKNKTKDSDYSLDTVACNGSLYYTEEEHKILDLYDPDVNTTANFETNKVAMFDNAAVNYDYVQKSEAIEVSYATNEIKACHPESFNGNNFVMVPDHYGDDGAILYHVYLQPTETEKGLILSDDIKVEIPSKYLLVEDYFTVEQLKENDLDFKVICNNSRLVPGYCQRYLPYDAHTGVMSNKPLTYPSLTFSANKDNVFYTFTRPDLYNIYSIEYTINGQRYTSTRSTDSTHRQGFFTLWIGDGFSIDVIEDNYVSERLPSLCAVNDKDYDITITDVVINKYYYDTKIWAPAIKNPSVLLSATQIFDGNHAVPKSDYFVEDTFEAITDEPTETRTGWTSKEAAMQVFLYDAEQMATSFQADSKAVPFIIDNELYIMKKGTNEIYDFYGNKYDTLGIQFFSTPSWIYANKGYDTLYAVDDSQISYYNRQELVASYSCDELRGKAVMNGKDLYGVTTGGKLIKCKDKVDILETKFVPVTIIDGTKVLTHKPMTNRYYVEGTVENTVLDFSNNISYIMLSYLLAIAFKSKQGADVTLLSNQLMSAEQQFYDSINKDINEQYTIKNVYKNRRFL